LLKGKRSGGGNSEENGLGGDPQCTGKKKKKKVASRVFKMVERNLRRKNKTTEEGKGEGSPRGRQAGGRRVPCMDCGPQDPLWG